MTAIVPTGPRVRVVPRACQFRVHDQVRARVARCERIRTVRVPPSARRRPVLRRHRLREVDLQRVVPRPLVRAVHVARRAHVRPVVDVRQLRPVGRVFEARIPERAALRVRHRHRRLQHLDAVEINRAAVRCAVQIQDRATHPPGHRTRPRRPVRHAELDPRVRRRVLRQIRRRHNRNRTCPRALRIEELEQECGIRRRARHPVRAWGHHVSFDRVGPARRRREVLLQQVVCRHDHGRLPVAVGDIADDEARVRSARPSPVRQVVAQVIAVAADPVVESAVPDHTGRRLAGRNQRLTDIVKPQRPGEAGARSENGHRCPAADRARRGHAGGVQIRPHTGGRIFSEVSAFVSRDHGAGRVEILQEQDAVGAVRGRELLGHRRHLLQEDVVGRKRAVARGGSATHDNANRRRAHRNQGRPGGIDPCIRRAVRIDARIRRGGGDQAICRIVEFQLNQAALVALQDIDSTLHVEIAAEPDAIACHEPAGDILVDAAVPIEQPRIRRRPDMPVVRLVIVVVE